MTTLDISADQLEIGPLWPTAVDSEAEAQWWRTHQLFAEAWIRDEWDNGFASFDLLTDAARALLYVPVARGRRGTPGERPRPRLSWAEVDAYEILLAHTAFLPGGEDDPVHYVALIGRFVEELGDIGVIPLPEYERLQLEWATWAERLLESWATGCWYTRDGDVVAAGGNVH